MKKLHGQNLALPLATRNAAQFSSPTTLIISLDDRFDVYPFPACINNCVSGANYRFGWMGSVIWGSPVVRRDISGGLL
jgi:hypothetical protein